MGNGRGKESGGEVRGGLNGGKVELGAEFCVDYDGRRKGLGSEDLRGEENIESWWELSLECMGGGVDKKLVLFQRGGGGDDGCEGQ